jgi:hypothetical protein
MTADYLLLAAPVTGIAVNFMSQLAIANMLAGERLLLVVVVAFCVGLAVAAGMTGFALSLTDLSTLDALALSASILIIYSAAGLALFAIVNLGETSLRVRMMQVLLAKPGGVTRDDLLANYNDRALIAVRLQRLREKGQIRVSQEIYYSRPSFLLIAGAGVRMLKRIIYRRR